MNIRSISNPRICWPMFKKKKPSINSSAEFLLQFMPMKIQMHLKIYDNNNFVKSRASGPEGRTRIYDLLEQ